MRQALWPSSENEHATAIAAFFQGDRRNPAEVFVAFDEEDQPIGFAEVSIRNYAEGCDSDRVAYLEGWYVELPARLKGVGAALVKKAEDWGRSQGCIEFGSDTEIDNPGSAAAHRSLGFSETDRIICFRKVL